MTTILQTFHDQSSLTIALVEGENTEEELNPKRVVFIATMFTEEQANGIAESLKPALDDEAYAILEEQIGLREWDPEFADAGTILLTDKPALWYFLFLREAHIRLMEDDDALPERPARRPPKPPGLQ